MAFSYFFSVFSHKVKAAGILIACLLTPLHTFAETFQFAVVPQFEARRLHQIWQPILNYLELETGHHFRMASVPTIPAFETEFLDGEYDFAYMNPYHLIMAAEQQGYYPIIRDNGRRLFGVLTVRKGSDVDEVKDLHGKTVAFPAPNALGASLQMRQELHDKFGIEVKPRYVKTHDSVYLNVLLGEAAAGGGVQKTLNRQKSNIKDNLLIIHKTTPVAPHPIAAHPRVPEHVVNAVTTALIELGKSHKGREMLARIPMKRVGSADIDDYAILDSMSLDRFYVKSN